MAYGRRVASYFRRGRTARQSRFNKKRSFRSQPKGRTVSSGQGVTVQHDARQIYRKKSMPRRRKKVWKRFVRKIHAVAEKELGSRMVVFNKTNEFTNATNGNHGIAYLGIYTANGTSDSWMSDLNQISALENPTNPTFALGSTVYDTTKFLFQSAVLDVTFRNTSYTNGTPNTLNSACKLEVDVYEILSGREWTDASATNSSINSALSRGATLQLNIGGTGTALSTSLRGATPFEFPAALGYYRMKILKKTKYFVSNGDTFTYQIRDPRRRVIYQERMEQIEGGNLPRWTRHLFIVFKAVPGIIVSASTGDTTEALSIGMTRKYFYKIEGVTEDRDRYIVG